MSNTPRKLRLGVIIFVLLSIGLYALFESKNLIQGPIISITEPKNGDTLSYNLLTVSGTAENIAYIRLNDRQIFVDETGRFSEKLLVYPGYSIITVSAQDKFGKKAEERIEVYLPEGLAPDIILHTPLATSSPATDTPAFQASTTGL